MEAILKFDLESPDDRQAHLRAVKSTDMAIMLWNFEQELFKMQDNDSLHVETLDEVHALWLRKMRDCGLNMDELIS